jgi:hypothetical protein
MEREERERARAYLYQEVNDGLKKDARRRGERQPQRIGGELFKVRGAFGCAQEMWREQANEREGV